MGWDIPVEAVRLYCAQNRALVAAEAARRDSAGRRPECALRLLVDEDAQSRTLPWLLRASGHDVIAVAELGLNGVADESALARVVPDGPVVLHGGLLLRRLGVELLPGRRHGPGGLRLWLRRPAARPRRRPVSRRRQHPGHGAARLTLSQAGAQTEGQDP